MNSPRPPPRIGKNKQRNSRLMPKNNLKVASPQGQELRSKVISHAAHKMAVATCTAKHLGTQGVF